MKCLKVRSTLLAVTGLAASALTTRAQTLHVIGIPSDIDSARVPDVSAAVIRTVLQADPGDVIRIIDAESQIPITVIPITKTTTDRARLRQTSPQIAQVASHLRSVSVETGRADHALHIPRFLDTVHSLIESEFRETKILLLGSADFGDGTDARWDFSGEAGIYPSDGHILASISVTDLGTLDRPKLSGVRCDFVNLEPIEDDQAEYFIKRFWTLHAAERGVTITSWDNDPERGVENHFRDLSSPVMEATIDRRDLRREIWRVDGSAALPNTWTLVICVDASGSMQAAFEQVRAEIPRLAEQLYKAGAEIRVMVMPFRQKPLPTFPLTVIRSAGSDGGQSITRLNRYLDGVELQSSSVDPDAAIRSALWTISSIPSGSTHICILVVGDTASETESSLDRQEKLLSDLSAWVGTAEGRLVRGVYLGAKNGAQEAFFRSLSSLSGESSATSFGQVADDVIERAAQITRGSKSR